MRDLFDEFEPMYGTFYDYEEEAMEFAVYDDDIIYPILGLVSEAGEVADKCKKLLRDDEVVSLGNLTAQQRSAIAKELGDVLWYITALAGDLGYALEDIATMNIDKLRDRKKRGALHGSGDVR